MPIIEFLSRNIGALLPKSVSSFLTAAGKAFPPMRWLAQIPLGIIASLGALVFWIQLQFGERKDAIPDVSLSHVLMPWTWTCVHPLSMREWQMNQSSTSRIT